MLAKFRDIQWAPVAFLVSVKFCARVCKSIGWYSNGAWARQGKVLDLQHLEKHYSGAFEPFIEPQANRTPSEAPRTLHSNQRLKTRPTKFLKPLSTLNLNPCFTTPVLVGLPVIDMHPLPHPEQLVITYKCNLGTYNCNLGIHS